MSQLDEIPCCILKAFRIAVPNLISSGPCRMIADHMIGQADISEPRVIQSVQEIAIVRPGNNQAVCETPGLDHSRQMQVSGADVCAIAVPRKEQIIARLSADFFNPQ